MGKLKGRSNDNILNTIENMVPQKLWHFENAIIPKRITYETRFNHYEVTLSSKK